MTGPLGGVSTILRLGRRHRQFCTSCGAPVLVRHPAIAMTDVPAGTVKGLTYKPTFHVHYGEKVMQVRKRDTNRIYALKTIRKAHIIAEAAKLGAANKVVKASALIEQLKTRPSCAIALSAPGLNARAK